MQAPGASWPAPTPARRRRPLVAWLMAAALLAPAAGAEAATCQTEAAGITFLLELIDSDEGAWAPWCGKLADFLQLKAPLPAAAHQDIETRLMGLDYFSEVACRASAQRLMCRLHPQVMVTDATVAGKLPFSMLREDIRRRLFLRSGTLMPRPAEMIGQQEERLVKYLVGEGYLDAKVHIDLAPQDLVVPNLGVALTAHVEVGPAFHVADIVISGSPVVADARVRRRFTPNFFLGLGHGRFRPPALVDNARELEEALQKEGYVAARVRARATRRPGQPAVDVLVDISAGPWVKLAFTGERPLAEGRLAAATTFAAAGAVDGLEIESSRLAVLRAAQEAGHDGATVAVTQDRQRGPVRLSFRVEAGPRRWLDAVVLEMPPMVRARCDEAALRGKMATRASFLLPETWVDERVGRDCQVLTGALRAAGFPSPKVSAAKRPHPRLADRLIAVFTIEAGPHNAVEDVALVGLPAAVRQAPLMASLACRDGGPWVEGAAEQDVGRLQGALVAEGYLGAQVTAHHETRPTELGSRTQVAFHIDAGVASRYRSLLVRGRVRTKLDVIEDEIRLSPGDVLRSAPITQTRRRLLGFNIFSNLTFTPLQASPDNPNTELMVAVQERQDQTLDGIVGFSTDDAFALGASFNDRNILGRAINLSADARFANARELSWLPERIAGVPTRIGNVDRLDLKLNTFHPFGAPFDTELGASAAYMDYATFRYDRIGGSVALVRTLLERGACRYCPLVVGRLAYELSTATLDTKENPADVGGPRPSPSQTNAATIGRLVPSATGERRDSSLDPHEGYFLSLRLEYANPYFAGPLYGGAADFWRLLQRVQGFYPIIGGPGGADSAPRALWGGPLILAAAAEWDAAGFFGAGGMLPASESFAYGGDNSVRGLSLRAAQVLLGDNVRGRFMLTASCELRWYVYRLGIGTIQLAGFVDYGSVAAELGGVFGNATVTYGPALRYVTQVGPLTLAYGRVLSAPGALAADPEAAPPHGRLHFMFGYSF